MNTDSKKLELIDWISHVKDYSVLEKIIQLKNSLGQTTDSKELKRNFEDGRHIFTYISDDFNEPLDDFKEYMQ
jgi:hypothetical protein